MNEIEVKIVKLEPMRVASATGFGESPEGVAIGKLAQWAEAHGMAYGSPEHEYYGFDNSAPTPGSPNYGYEMWMTVGPEMQASQPVTIKEHPGGTFAVAHCKGTDTIFPTWKALVAWVERSPYRMGRVQCLEKHFSFGDVPYTEMEFDLYQSIVE